MKNIFFVALAIVCSSATISAQSKAPKEVETAFYSKFPKATKIKWDKESTTEYEASFTENNVKHSANFSIKGEWLETESPTTFALLPEKVQNSFNTAHKGVKVKAVAKIENSSGETLYEIEVKKGLKNVEYFYNQEGKIVK
ncbi:PepSY-like domain-containing protein [Flavobacterium sp.]|uniref:PepSY-like domain-containing protein n=1 Tax=Flavobacterium sp. TaxID=239 RepID=UPI0035B2F005